MLRRLVRVCNVAPGRRLALAPVRTAAASVLPLVVCYAPPQCPALRSKKHPRPDDVSPIAVFVMLSGRNHKKSS